MTKTKAPKKAPKPVKPKRFRFRPNKDIDGNGNTNDIRADRGLEAAQIYAMAAGYRRIDAVKYGLEAVIQDLVCDLGHLCDREGLDIEAIAANGIGCWKEER